MAHRLEAAVKSFTVHHNTAPTPDHRAYITPLQRCQHAVRTNHAQHVVHGVTSLQQVIDPALVAHPLFKSHCSLCCREQLLAEQVRVLFVLCAWRVCMHTCAFCTWACTLCVRTCFVQVHACLRVLCACTCMCMCTCLRVLCACAFCMHACACTHRRVLFRCGRCVSCVLCLVAHVCFVGVHVRSWV